MFRIFGLSYNKIRMVAPAIGGAFGGKLEVTVEPAAAVLSRMTGKPVKAEYNRKESILSTRVRHASVNYVKTGLDEEHGGPGQLRFHFPQAPRQSQAKGLLKEGAGAH